MTKTDKIIERFEKRYDHYNPIHDKGDKLPVWTGSDYEDMKAFIRSELSSLLKELGEEVLNLAKDHYWDSQEKDKEIIIKHIEHIVTLLREEE